MLSECTCYLKFMRHPKFTKGMKMDKNEKRPRNELGSTRILEVLEKYYKSAKETGK